ncbi:gliding motility-associated C-terminal domain-containing protein [Sphingobacterium sp. SGG-5]|uniref:MBG domain-containing protein n=1 Tax=Sphingobacterium sp. SGG-5 TaxID=2710881 RepID=UPI0013EC4266|nr:MBG domain-containing protein [Sphingobacterium sp. SGG-5]NGM61278.1 gliding motility-associated C-terminal domain-containing protein [Sphingobacterium sp. SGG-5]
MKSNLLLIFLFSCFCSEAVFAQTPSSENILFVKKGSAGNGSSWTHAMGELAEALTWAGSNWDAEADGPLQIWVTSGRYLPTTNTANRNATFQLVKGVKVYGGFSGVEAVLTERDWAKNVTILSGDIDGNDVAAVITDVDQELKGNNSYTVVNGSGTDITASLDGFIITAGHNPSNGGGIYNDEGSPALVNLTITGNKAMYGGGLYNQGSSPELRHITISNNRAESGYGDGIFNDPDSHPILKNTIISGSWKEEVGSYAITFTDDDITPMLTIIAKPEQQKVYGAEDPVLTYTASGFLPGDNNTIFSGTLSRDIGEDVGSYPIKQGTLSADNYALAFIGSDFTINKSPQEITLVAPEELSLDVGIQALTVSSSSGLPVTIEVDDASVATLSGTDLHLQGPGVVTVTATQEGNQNYEAAAPVSTAIRVVESPKKNVPIRVHKALSPNGDGVNDFLFIDGIENYPENKFIVFDAGGNILADIAGYDNGSHVLFGEQLNDGTYFYYLDVTVDGRRERIKGFFEVKRK